MQLIKNNPYRIVGLLVGATAKEQDHQVKRLKLFIGAEKESDEDFNFPILGNQIRTVDSVTYAASKLNLDSDKINAALFWFYDGKTNLKTDEEAFKSMKESDQKFSVDIWKKIIGKGDITLQNSSAYQNLSTLLLCNAFNGAIINQKLLEQGILLKLKFLESEFVKDFIILATDKTVKSTTKIDLQLAFLTLVQNEIDKNDEISSNNFIKILSKQEFYAKEIFLKGFIQKPIDQIETKIEETKRKQKINKENAGEIGNELFNATKNDLAQLKSILGDCDIKIISISDKLANEILQCSITLFNYFYETETEVAEIALELNNKANSIALGSVVKERINESSPIIEKYSKEKPRRKKLNLIKSDLEFISDNLNKFQSLPASVSNANNLIVNCKSYIVRIKIALGVKDEMYLNLSSTIVNNAQNMLISAVNKELEIPRTLNRSLPGYGLSRSLESTIKMALDTTFNIGSFDMSPILRSQYNENLAGIISIAKQLNISILSPKDKVKQELKMLEIELDQIQNKYLYIAEINSANVIMSNIKEWQLFRLQSERVFQINQQQGRIDHLITKSKIEKELQILKQQNRIKAIKSKLQITEY